MSANRYFREPIPEIYDAARYLDAAVSAHLAGHAQLADELFTLANNKEIWMRIPDQAGHAFHGKLDSHSSANWTLIPRQVGQ